MTKTVSKISIAALMAGTMLSPAAAEISVEGNVGATTDYIWRGDVQGSGGASLSGGIDIDFGNGIAAGTWVGTLGDSDDDANYEQDLYVSYSTEIAGYPLEVGYISYTYPGVANSLDDFADYYLSTSVAGLGISYYMLASAEAIGVENNDETYLSLDYDYGLPDNWSMTLHYGLQSGEFNEDDVDTSIAFSKGEMTFTVSGNEDDDTRAIISWGRSY